MRQSVILKSTSSGKNKKKISDIQYGEKYSGRRVKNCNKTVTVIGFHCMHSPKFTIHRIREISPKSSLLSHLDQVNSRRIDYGVLISMALQ